MDGCDDATRPRSWKRAKKGRVTAMNPPTSHVPRPTSHRASAPSAELLAAGQGAGYRCSASATRPVPRATQVSGSSALRTGIVSSAATAGPGRAADAPPPARVMPCSMMSATSSGGVSSIAGLDQFDDRVDRAGDRVAQLRRGDLDRFRQPGQQVAPAQRRRACSSSSG